MADTSAIPDVQLGVVMAFPCPRCGCWRKPARAYDGCYETTCCKVHLPNIAINLTYRLTAVYVRAPSPN